jgi:DNA-binding response OmpR family regulator
MRIVIADDDPVARGLARAALTNCTVAGAPVDVQLVEDGHASWHAVRDRCDPTLLVLDRAMPGMDGVDLVRRARAEAGTVPLYVVMVTAAGRPEDVAAGLDGGADDYVVKPFNVSELRARVRVGLRMLELQESLANRVAELQQALASVKQLTGLLPMCSYCKKIRVDEQYWQQVESYVSDHTEAVVTHGICPECYPAVLDDATGRSR